jgi:hypothetical protein
MVLQGVNKKIRDSKASSLYCIWIKNEQQPGSALTAVWIDSEMSAFEGQFAFAARTAASPARDSQSEESDCTREPCGQE